MSRQGLLYCSFVDVGQILIPYSMTDITYRVCVVLSGLIVAGNLPAVISRQTVSFRFQYKSPFSHSSLGMHCPLVLGRRKMFPGRSSNISKIVKPPFIDRSGKKTGPNVRGIRNSPGSAAFTAWYSSTPPLSIRQALHEASASFQVPNGKLRPEKDSGAVRSDGCPALRIPAPGSWRGRGCI